ncbi:MAG: hypothetical protein IH888_08745 [Planctomycetes bacterium]|nr:hypothetical protein [Planctomycetota bacterium]
MAARRPRSLVPRLLSICGPLVAGAAAAEPAPQPQEQFPYLAAVGTDVVDVRAGAHFRYYAFGRLHDGDLVKVFDEKGEWARVAMLGPAFEKFFGYVKYPIADPGPIQLSPDGASAVTIAPTDLFAPNRDAGYKPKKSWKPLITLPAQRTLRVLKTLDDRDEKIYKVTLPHDVQGWVKLTSLRPATPSEQAAWEAALAPTRISPTDQEGAQEAAHSVQAPLPQADSLHLTQPPVVPLDEMSVQSALAGGMPQLGAGSTESADSPAAAPAGRPRKALPRGALAMLKDLEAAYARLLAEPVDTAELAPLRLLYLDLARQHRGHRVIVEYSQRRARQLQLWSEMQERKLELSRLQRAARDTADNAQKARLALEAGGYSAMGRLNASSVYDGSRLPRLFRLRDPETGRTIVYLKESERFNLPGMLGELIGIVGKKSYDGGLQITIIAPQRIEVLTPQE